MSEDVYTPPTPAPPGARTSGHNYDGETTDGTERLARSHSLELGTVVDRIPTWASGLELETDGYVVFTRVIRERVEIQQSSHLAVNEEAGTVSYQAVDGLQLWLPYIENSISPEKARRLLVDLQELLVVADEIEAKAC